MNPRERINLLLVRHYHALLRAATLGQWLPYKRRQTSDGSLLTARRETPLWIALLVLGAPSLATNIAGFTALMRQARPETSSLVVSTFYCTISAAVIWYALAELRRQRILGSTELLIPEWPIMRGKSSEVRFRRGNPTHVKPRSVRLEAECFLTYYHREFGKRERRTSRKYHQETAGQLHGEFPTIEARFPLTLGQSPPKSGSGSEGDVEWFLIATFESADGITFKSLFPVEVA